MVVINQDAETSIPLLRPIRQDLLQDTSMELPGFVASELEEVEQEYLEPAIYGTVNHEATGNISDKRLKIIMLSMYMGIFLAALDNTIVSTLLAHIASEFNELPRVAWIATSYLLASACFQPLYGKLSDIFGRKPLLLLSNIFFVVGSLICGLSPSLWWLVAGRFVAGIGGGGITSMSSITTSDIVPLRNRALYQGICNFFFGLGTASGGLFGGWFSDHGGGWRIAFLIQVPFGIISVCLLQLYLELPKSSKNNGQLSGNSKVMQTKFLAIDWLGALSLVTSLLFFMLLTSLGGNEIALSSNLFRFFCLAAGISALVFIVAESRIANDPILPVLFLKDRSILGASLANWFCMMGVMCISYYLPIYFASVLSMQPTDIGKRMIPSFFSTALGSLGAGYYMKKTGKYYWFVMAACFLSVLGVVHILLITPDVSTLEQYSLIFVPGLGSAILITVALLAMIASVPHQHHAATTSISYAFRSTGSTLGVSIGAAIFRKSLASLLYSKVMSYESEAHPRKELLHIIAKASSSSDWVQHQAPQFIRPALIASYHSACKHTFAFCLCCAASAAVSMSIIKEHKLHTTLARNTTS